MKHIKMKTVVASASSFLFVTATLPLASGSRQDAYFLFSKSAKAAVVGKAYKQDVPEIVGKAGKAKAGKAKLFKLPDQANFDEVSMSMSAINELSVSMSMLDLPSTQKSSSDSKNAKSKAFKIATAYSKSSSFDDSAYSKSSSFDDSASSRSTSSSFDGAAKTGKVTARAKASKK